jgi:hypothetical protein
MENKNKETILKIAKLLQQLAIIKNADRSENQLAAMAKYLAGFFTFEQVSQASEEILQRSPYFPGIDSFFSILKPLESPEARAIILKYELKQTIADSGFNFIRFKEIAKPEIMQLVEIVGWKGSQEIYDKEAIELFKTIISKKGETYAQINQ